ncbi:MAG: thioredoxin domain-containing protein [bacterium]
MNKVNTVLLLLLPWLLMPNSMGENESEVLLKVNGEPILRSQVEESAQTALDQLHTERIRFETQEVLKRYRIIQNSINSLAADKVLALEADAKGVSKEELVTQEVDSKVEPATDEEVEEYYEKNKNRFQGSKEESLEHVRKLVQRNKIITARNQYVTSLKERYGVEVLLPPLRMDVASDGFPSVGPSNAPVTIVEFSDFECPYCSRLAKTIKKVANDYPDTVRLVFRQFPLKRIHPNAQRAAEAALCAGDQGKFWEMHDLMFEDQKNLKLNDLKEKAESIGLVKEEFSQCLESGKHAEAIQTDLYDGVRAGVSGTPAMFVNGIPMSGQVPYESFVKIIEEELERQ